MDKFLMFGVSVNRKSHYNVINIEPGIIRNQVVYETKPADFRIIINRLI
jgi:hypothetical protein